MGGCHTLSNEIKGLNEECGVFGVCGSPNAAHVTYLGLHSLQHRGQEGAGIVAENGHQLSVHLGRGLLADVFSDKQDLEQLHGKTAVGHVRYGTSGNDSLVNIQPFTFKFNGTDVALAHNGNLTNARTLRQKLHADFKFNSNSDTEVLVHLLEQRQSLDFLSALKESLNIVQGGFAFVLLYGNELIATCDPHGFRPLSIGKLPNGSYVAASETCALDAVGADFVRDVQPGELLRFDKNGMHYDRFTNNTKLAVCSMEYIYFARPDSVIHGVSVHQARMQMGRYLAKEQPREADMVIGVPNSSLSAAMGYAKGAGLPYEMGLIKNQYVARTFIQPTQELREQGVKLKFSVIRQTVAGKRVIVVDDSLVRGTTSRQLVKLLREAGAKEVHLLIASPPLRYPCFYGIDISTRAELMAAKMSVPEMCAAIGADSLGFLSIPSLIKAIDLPTGRAEKNGGLTVAYFDGNYPTPLYDYETDYLNSLKLQPRSKEMSK